MNKIKPNNNKTEQQRNRATTKQSVTPPPLLAVDRTAMKQKPNKKAQQNLDYSHGSRSYDNVYEAQPDVQHNRAKLRLDLAT